MLAQQASAIGIIFKSLAQGCLLLMQALTPVFGQAYRLVQVTCSFHQSDDGRRWRRASRQCHDFKAGFSHQYCMLPLRGKAVVFGDDGPAIALIHISEPTRRTPISYAVFCLKKKYK